MYKKILIPTDGSPLSEATALTGIEFAQQISADVVGVFIAPEYQYTIVDDALANHYPTREGYALSMQKSGEVYLGAIKKAAEKTGVAYAGITKTSDYTAQTIVQTAQEFQCDLIFMGSHGRSGLGKLLLGSVTSKVLALCDLPVFVYRLKHDDKTEKIHQRNDKAMR
jgi:nucleotide-binding universal stress UspA family protein